MQKRDYASAAQMFEKRIQCDPRSISSYLNGAASYMQVKNNARARELLLKSLELYPEFLQGRLWLGRLYMIMDSLDQAKGQYQQVLQIIGPNPEKKQLADAGEAYYYIGAYYFQTREYARAVESFKKAMSYGNDMSALHLQLGQALLQMLDKKNDAAVNKRIVEESVKEIRRSVAVDPNNCQGHLWLAQGLVLSRVEGDDEANKKLVEEACGEYRKALRCDPGLKSDVMKGMERIGCQGK